MSSREELRRDLLALGFDAVRFTRPGGAVPAALSEWLAQGFHADMQWMERTAEKRLQPELVLSGARTLILLGVNYGTKKEAPGSQRKEPVEAGGRRPPTWARYALYADYHDTVKAGLVEAGRALEKRFSLGAADYRVYVDTGPVLERGWAERAGLGFIGKNAMLISRDYGNWLFLATILTRAEIEPDEPLGHGRGRTDVAADALEKDLGLMDENVSDPGRKSGGGRVGLLCGKCTRCIDACPTAAIVAPGTVDARKCVSYQTIENKGIIPRELRAGIGDRVYGCDVCAEVCPWNRFAQESRQVLLAARRGPAELTLREILELTPERFAEVFRKTPIKRVKLAGLLRNACVVAGNVGAEDCLGRLVELAAQALPMVRAHAVWAVFKIAGRERAETLLRDAKSVERDPGVTAEYALSSVDAR